MVRTRTRYISLISTLLRRDGLRIHNSGYAPSFLKRLARLELSVALREEVEPLLVLMRSLNEQIKRADEQLAKLVKEDEVVTRLCTVPGVGPVTATSFVSTLDEAARFASAKQARAYLGLVPSEHSSGERQQRGHISKAGPGRARHMLVEDGMDDPPATQPDELSTARVGDGHRRTARVKGRCRCPGAQVGGYPVCDVERRHEL
jgi:transposase